MANDREKTLQELHQRIAAERLPKLSAEALRSYKREVQHGPKPVLPSASKPLFMLSPEALRLFYEKANPIWPWKRP